MTGYGDVPLNGTFTTPASEMTVIVSMTVPNNTGLKTIRNAVLSKPEIPAVFGDTVKALFVVVILLIDNGMTEAFRAYTVIMAES